MSWRDLFLKNFWWKLFSLLIAMIVWSTYHINGGTFSFGAIYDTSATRDWMGYRPRILTRQSDKFHYQLSPEQVSVTVSGTRELVTELDTRDFVVFVDMQDYVQGGTNLLPVQVRTPPGIKVTASARPDKVLVQRLAPEFLPKD